MQHYTIVRTVPLGQGDDGSGRETLDDRPMLVSDMVRRVQAIERTGEYVEVFRGKNLECRIYGTPPRPAGGSMESPIGKYDLAARLTMGGFPHTHKEQG